MCKIVITKCIADPENIICNFGMSGLVLICLHMQMLTLIYHKS